MSFCQRFAFTTLYQFDDLATQPCTHQKFHGFASMPCFHRSWLLAQTVLRISQMSAARRHSQYPCIEINLKPFICPPFTVPSSTALTRAETLFPELCLKTRWNINGIPHTWEDCTNTHTKDDIIVAVHCTHVCNFSLRLNVRENLRMQHTHASSARIIENTAKCE